jgi:hypothetical protein
MQPRTLPRRAAEASKNSVTTLEHGNDLDGNWRMTFEFKDGNAHMLD